SELYIGSSNLSISALTDGVEWNYRLSESVDKEGFDKFVKEFEDLFYNHSIVVDDEVLREYSRNWKKPLIIGELKKNEKKSREYVPRGAQIEALYALKATREEGADKVLIHAATGVGKTYLAAFDSLSFKRVLFVAHREEILRQAYESFRNVRNEENFSFFNSKIKDCDRNVVFASVYSLGRKTI
ncbi:MAG: DEAD/DEAH box helicase family protein, partial [Clostridiaceae bacterium]|nr:DEAD/DEAH box helicase family protein [Clostridiaceae bacterium]